jgi:hypothetical protein
MSEAAHAGIAKGWREMSYMNGLGCRVTPLPEFVKLCGARAPFRHFVTLPVTNIVKFLGKIDGHPE